MKAEEWRPIAGFPHYEISSHGRVLSRAPLFRTDERTPRILRPGNTTGGYPTVALCRDGTPTTRYVHHLVAEAFIGPRPDGLELRHLDGDPANSALTNLQYGTTSENAYDRVRHGTHGQARKTHCKHGHPFDQENTRLTPRGHRVCRACHFRSEAERRARRALAAANISSAA